MAAGLERARLPPLVRSVLEQFLSALRVRFGARLQDVRLFGSYARGEAHEDSDVDCLVLLDRVELADDRAIRDAAGDLVWQKRIVISPLVMSAAAFDAWKRQERRAPLEIDRDGIRL